MFSKNHNNKTNTVAVDEWIHCFCFIYLPSKSHDLILFSLSLSLSLSLSHSLSIEIYLVFTGTGRMILLLFYVHLFIIVWIFVFMFLVCCLIWCFGSSKRLLFCFFFAFLKIGFTCKLEWMDYGKCIQQISFLCLGKWINEFEEGER